MEPIALIIFQFVVLIFSVMIHEVAHGVVAEWLGDPTAREAGRITLNPLKHIDPMGSVVIPAFLFLVQSPILLGWAKPVPYDPNRVANPRSASAKIAAAGPISNLALAVFFAIILRVAVGMGGSEALIEAFAIIVLLNIWLAVFNLMPVPPLDGSKVLFALLPPSQGAYAAMDFLERYGLILIFGLLFFAGPVVFPVVRWIFNLLVG